MTRNQNRPALPRQLLLLATCLLLALSTLNPLRLQLQPDNRGPEIAALLASDILAPGRSQLIAPAAVHPGSDGALAGSAFTTPPRPDAGHRLHHLAACVPAMPEQAARWLGPRGPPPALTI